MFAEIIFALCIFIQPITGTSLTLERRHTDIESDSIKNGKQIDGQLN